MAENVAIRNGGQTDELGFERHLRRLSTNDEGVIRAGDMLVAERAAGANKSVDIAIGDAFISYLTHGFYVFNTAIYNLVIADNASGNPRIDAIVAYEDLAVVSAVNPNNPGALKFIDIAGAPAGAPTAPSDADIDAALGANPWIRLANVAVANGFASIVNANITDTRVRFALSSKPTIRPFTKSGNFGVANDIDFQYIVPPGVGAINRLDAVVKTCPTGADLVLRVYNVTQAWVVGTVTISAGAYTGSSTSMTNPTVVTGDKLRLDCTAIGAVVTGADGMVVPT